MRENRSAYQRIWFRPRVLRDVTEVDFSSTILGHKVSLGTVSLFEDLYKFLMNSAVQTSLPIYMTA
jgi:hypothetical protein